jgi:RNA polymerase sigma-70 factor (ECF subfamily)
LNCEPRAGWLDPATQFDALYRSNRKQVHTYLERFSRQEAEDLTQQTFTRAFRARLRYVPLEPPIRWLIRIARRVAIDAWRKHYRQDLGIPEDVEEFGFGDRALAFSEQGYERAEDRTQLAGLSRELTPSQRQLLQLRFGEDLTLREVGRRMHRSQAVISRRLSTAIATMRAAA